LPTQAHLLKAPGKAVLIFLKFVTTEGVGREKEDVVGLNAGISLMSASLKTLFSCLGGSAMKLGNLPKVLFFFPGAAGLNFAPSWISGRFAADANFFGPILTTPKVSLGLLKVP